MRHKEKLHYYSTDRAWQDSKKARPLHEYGRIYEEYLEYRAPDKEACPDKPRTGSSRSFLQFIFELFLSL